MKSFKMKWALIVALAVPGVAVNSCWTAFVAELRDSSIAGVGTFTQNTMLDLLDTFVNLNGTE